MATGRLDHEISVVYSSLHQLTIIIHHSGLLLAAVHWEADNLHLHEGINDLTERCYTVLRHSFILTTCSERVHKPFNNQIPLLVG